jgi:hypothetical protein
MSNFSILVMQLTNGGNDDNPVLLNSSLMMLVKDLNGNSSWSTNGLLDIKKGE